MLRHVSCGIRKLLKRKYFEGVSEIRYLSNEAVKKVFLHDFHIEKNAKMVNFAGFLMPLQYSDLSISASHRHTREHVSIFDVSHMLQTKIFGKDRIHFIESLIVSDIEGLDNNQGTLTLFTNESGGIIDDLIVTKTDNEYLYVVSNAGCSNKDLAHMQTKKEEFKHKGYDVDLEVINDRALLAVQGPGMIKVLQPLVEYDLGQLSFMRSTRTTICGIKNCRMTRCGYTGEDGVEISVPHESCRLIAESLLQSKNDSVKLAGLGARDTLRLEAGLCLYGNDICEDTTPVKASLAWTISKKRRTEGNFPGSKIILEELRNKPNNKRVGFVSTGPCPRANTPISDTEGNLIGTITSGCPSPCLNMNISMGYVEMKSVKPGTKVFFTVHKKSVQGTVAKMPFVSTKYYVK